MRGRKPKPTIVKQLAGNPGRRPLNKHEPQPPALSGASPPPWLDPLGQEVWGWYAPRLIATRTLTDVDLHNLEAFCSAYARWRKAEDVIARDGITVAGGDGNPKKHPAVTVAHEALRQMQMFGSSLGLDPVSRSRIKVPGGPTKNPFSAL